MVIVLTTYREMLSQDQIEELFHLHKLYIVPHLQKKGVGRFLLEKAFDYARGHADTSRCIVELNMNRDNPTQHFYEKMGMKIHDRGDFHIGIPIALKSL